MNRLSTEKIDHIRTLAAAGESQNAIAAAVRCSRLTVMIYLRDVIPTTKPSRYGTAEEMRQRARSRTYVYLTTACGCGNRKQRGHETCASCLKQRDEIRPTILPRRPSTTIAIECTSSAHYYVLDAAGTGACVHCGTPRRSRAYIDRSPVQP